MCKNHFQGTKNLHPFYHVVESSWTASAVVTLGLLAPRGTLRRPFIEVQEAQ